MRIRIARLITIFVVILNILSLYFILKFVINLNLEESSAVNFRRASTATTLPQKLTDQQFIEKSITLLIRSLESFENDIPGTVSSFLLLYPNLHILVVSDTVPYPPLKLDSMLNSTKNLKILNMQLDLMNPFEEKNPFFSVNTKYVLFVPDSTRITSKNLLRTMISKLTRQPPHLLAAPVSPSHSVQCLKIHLELREWFIQYESMNGDLCDAVLGKHVILVETARLKKLPKAFMLPFPNALYVQTSAQNLKVKLMRDLSFDEGKPLFQTEHARWKLDELNKVREEEMLRQFRLKKVIRETGDVALHGCTRSTPRCFGTVIGDMPQYLWEGRWTPPCCLAWLRQTARHVFKQLESVGIRYWLEGGSLLGAMRSSDILPWDYDVDVGIYLEDVSKCPWLAEAETHPVVDNEGYVWEKATEGDFFRVQFSASNHLHVDLFPFFSRNGTMTKNTWFASHKQDCEFPEHFLHPMASIEFVGQEVSAPNNIRDFLELKFGKGVVENPKYPNPQKLKFPPSDVPETTEVTNL